MEKLIKKIINKALKSLYESLKIDHLNDKIVFMKKHVKNRKKKKKFIKKLCKKKVIFLKIYVKIGKKIK